MRLSPCVLVQPDGWARGEREGYGEPCDVTSLSLSKNRLVLDRNRREMERYEPKHKNINLRRVRREQNKSKRQDHEVRQYKQPHQKREPVPGALQRAHERVRVPSY